MTPFAALQSVSGLSNREAAAYLTVSERTIEDWRTGRKRPAPGPLAEMAALIDRQASAAEKAADEIERRGASADTVEIGYPEDDAEAQSIGWPCVGAWRAMAGAAISLLVVGGRPPRSIQLVPRGSTLTTGAAGKTG